MPKRSKVYHIDGQDVTIQLTNVSVEVDTKSWKRFTDRVFEDFDDINKKGYVVRILALSYINGLIDIKELEKKLGELKQDIWI